jgi:hypothetical protein
VAVEIGLDADALLGAKFTVTVTGSDDRLEVDANMVRGDPERFENIPLGEVTISIGEACR